MFKHALPKWLLAVCFASFSAATVSAQNPVTWLAADGSWDVGTNWDNPLFAEFPPAFDSDEFGIISNNGLAFVDAPTTDNPGGIDIGLGEGESGTLEIRSGGVLISQSGNVVTGDVRVGVSGTGHLDVQPGGSFQSRRLVLDGASDSTVTLGGAAAGTATVEIDVFATFNRELRVVGPNVDFNANLINFGGASTFIPEITGTTHSALRAQGSVGVGGVLKPEFSGVTPGVGDSWNLFDAPGITGQFAEIDTSNIPSLPFGQVYEFRTVSDPGSVNGVYGQLAVEQKLVLNVDRNSGEVSVNTGPQSVGIVGYSVESVLGGVNPAGWDSLANQSVAGWSESPAGGTANAISEITSGSAASVTSGSPLILGDAYQEPAAIEFGTELEDITFEYYTATGDTVEGIVNYTGEKVYNNIVLSVDPATGEARFVNESSISVNLVGYRISSESDSLLHENGDWLSLDDDDRAGGDWDEANPSASMITELKPAGDLLLTEGLGFGLGNPFKTTSNGGTEDLVFQYLFQGEDDFRTGVVLYEAIPDDLAGDYNGDGMVNLADYTVWRDNLGATVPNGTVADGNNDGTINTADYGVWKANFGMSLGAAVSGIQAVGVPEPSCLSIMLLAFGGALIGRLRK